jgi:hypothetical protein
MRIFEARNARPQAIISTGRPASCRVDAVGGRHVRERIGDHRPRDALRDEFVDSGQQAQPRQGRWSTWLYDVEVKKNWSARY